MDDLEAANVELKSLAKRIKDKDRKVATLETQITDLEEEKFLAGERHKEELQSRQAIFQHTLDDAKRHTLDLEEKVRNLKDQLNEQNNRPTKDRAVSLEASQDEHVMQLEAEIERLKETLVRQENENYECVAILKEENRKLKQG